MTEQKTKPEETAATSLAKIEKAKDEIAFVIRKSLQAEISEADVDLLIEALGKKCARYTSLKQLHREKWE